MMNGNKTSYSSQQVVTNEVVSNNLKSTLDGFFVFYDKEAKRNYNSDPQRKQVSAQT
jgi:hypothetical protein